MPRRDHHQPAAGRRGPGCREHHESLRALVLHVCKLTDPAGTPGKTNLTTNYILKELLWPENVRDELKRLNDRLMDFRSKLEPARNKRIAHTDLHSQVQHLEAIGTFEKGADARFFEDLESFLATFKVIQCPPSASVHQPTPTRSFVPSRRLLSTTAARAVPQRSERTTCLISRAASCQGFVRHRCAR
jgi:hypothetical protein